jgi:thioredoxin reductase (NADPH)
MSEQIRNVIILGSGPAGLTAAIYLARAETQPLVIAGQEWGGQLMETTEVENFPGFSKGIMGQELMKEMRDQATKFGAEFVDENATAVDFKSQSFKVIVGDKTYLSHAVVVATGASAKWLGLPSETKYKGHGVSACATCDGFFFKDKRVAVVGGGDASFEEAGFLTKFAKEVVLLVRAEDENKLKASVYMRDHFKSLPKTSIRYHVEVTEVLGDDTKMTGLKIKDLSTNQEIEENFDGLFVAIGHKPNTDLFKDQLEREPKFGYLNVKENTRSNIDGVFVAGDVQDFRYRQAISAAGLGCMAALDVEKYLSEHLHLRSRAATY